MACRFCGGVRDVISSLARSVGLRPATTRQSQAQQNQTQVVRKINPAWPTRPNRE